MPPKILMCRRHWQMLPKGLRDDVWRSTQRGIEQDKQPSPAYLAAARRAVDWIADPKPVSARGARPLGSPSGEPDAPAGVVPRRGEPDHLCAVCGARAPFGFGVFLRRGQPGVWACAAHRDEVARGGVPQDDGSAS